MDFKETPITIGEAKRKVLLNSFGIEDAVEKSITTEEFTSKYGEGHDIFSVKDVESFEVAAKAADGNTDEVCKAISEEFATLSPVLVKGTEDNVSLVYVRESKAPEGSNSIEGEESGVEA